MWDFRAQGSELRAQDSKGFLWVLGGRKPLKGTEFSTDLHGMEIIFDFTAVT